MKQKIAEAVRTYKSQMNAMSDYIYDNPELGMVEYKACAYVTDALDKLGYQIDHHIAGLETAFRATYEQGAGGVSLGLLIEYDALETVGHACAHHMQSAVMIYMAEALRDVLKGESFKIVIYGTPAEETAGCKVKMAEEGCFKDIDVALMVHGWNYTVVDTTSIAMKTLIVTFHGKAAHAAVEPESGVSALDALLLTFQGVEYMREHVKDDVRMHYTVLDAGGPANVVPEKAVGKFMLRDLYIQRLLPVIDRFKKVVEGAALMTGATYDIDEVAATINKVPSHILNKLILDNAAEFGAPDIRPPELVRGSSDFGNVMYELPGCCLRIQVIEGPAQAHSKAWYDIGKSDKMHEAQVLAAQILGGVCYDLIADPALVTDMKEEHAKNKLAAQSAR